MLIEVLDESKEDKGIPKAKPSTHLSIINKLTKKHVNRVMSLRNKHGIYPCLGFSVASLTFLFSTINYYLAYKSGNSESINRYDQLYDQYLRSPISNNSSASCNSFNPITRPSGDPDMPNLKFKPCWVLEQANDPRIQVPALCLATITELCSIDKILGNDASYMSSKTSFILMITSLVAILAFGVYFNRRSAKSYLTEDELREVIVQLQPLETIPLLQDTKTNLIKYASAINDRMQTLNQIQGRRFAFFSALRPANADHKQCALRQVFLNNKIYDEEISKMIFSYLEPNYLIKPTGQNAMIDMEEKIEDASLNRDKRKVN